MSYPKTAIGSQHVKQNIYLLIHIYCHVFKHLQVLLAGYVFQTLIIMISGIAFVGIC